MFNLQQFVRGFIEKKASGPMAVPRITVHGRVADLATHEFSNGGLMVRLRVVANDRRKNPDTGEWEDTDSYWATVKVLSDKLARHVAESIRKGEEVLVTGRLRTVKWTTDEGTERTSDEIIADAVGPSLTFRTIKHGEHASSTAREEAPEAPQPSWAERYAATQDASGRSDWNSPQHPSAAWRERTGAGA